MSGERSPIQNTRKSASSGPELDPREGQANPGTLGQAGDAAARRMVGSAGDHLGPDELLELVREGRTDDAVARLRSLVERGGGTIGTDGTLQLPGGIKGGAERLVGPLAQVRRLGDDLTRRGALFDLPIAIQKILHPQATARLFDKPEDGLLGSRFSCATTTRIEGSSIDRISSALLGNWGRWWGGGRVSGYAQAEGGERGMKFHFEPVLDKHGKCAFQVDVTVGDRVQVGPGHWRFPMTLNGDLHGEDLYIDVKQVDGGFMISSVWNDVRESTPVPSGALVGYMHTCAEAGTLSLPGVPTVAHRGYLGLIELLKADEPGAAKGAGAKAN